MRVTVHPAGDDACAFYRMTEPARVLADQGADVTVTRDLTYRVGHDRNHRPIGLAETPDTDVVVMQRPLHRWKVDLIDVLQRAGVAVVVELDDDFGSIPEGNPAWLDAHREWMTVGQWEGLGRPGPVEAEAERQDGSRWVKVLGVLAPSSEVWLRRACKLADLVTCTTPALAERYAPHGRVAVLPNLVPERYLSVEAPAHDGMVVVGWGGSVATHVGDLEATGGGVARAVEESGARFHVIGTGVRVRRSLGLTEAPTSTGWVELDEWPAALAALDVGIVPLAPNRFNEAKSSLKMLEMAAVGVPAVVSPTPDNLRLGYREGFVTTRYASDARSWFEQTAALLSDPEELAHAAGVAREAAARCTYEAHAGRWWDAWTQALANRRGRRQEAA